MSDEDIDKMISREAYRSALTTTGLSMLPPAGGLASGLINYHKNPEAMAAIRRELGEEAVSKEGDYLSPAVNGFVLGTLGGLVGAAAGQGASNLMGNSSRGKAVNALATLLGMGSGIYAGNKAGMEHQLEGSISKYRKKRDSEEGRD